MALRVAMATSTLPRSGNVTGTPAHVAKTTRALQASGVEVVPLELDVGGAGGRVRPMRLLHQAIGQLRASRPDVVHAHGHVVGALMLPATRWLGLPLVIEPHGLYVRSSGQKAGTRPLLSALAKRAEVPALRWAHHVVAQALAMKQYLVARGLEEGSITVIYPGLRTAEFSEYRGPPAEVPSARPGDKLVLYLGSTHAYQGLDLLAQAQRHLPHEYRVVLVLSSDAGPPEDAVARFGFDPARTTATHPASPSEIPAWTRAADVLVHARPDVPDNINVQSKLGLYLASGKPVVATDVGDYKAIMGASGGCVLCAPEAGAIARAVVAAASDPAVARAAEVDNLALARRYFEAEVNVSRLVGIYLSVAKVR